MKMKPKLIGLLLLLLIIVESIILIQATNPPSNCPTTPTPPLPEPEEDPATCNVNDHRNSPHHFGRARLKARHINKWSELVPTPERIYTYNPATDILLDPACPITCEPTKLTLTISEFTWKILPKHYKSGPYNGKTLVWGYNKQLPGPTILARRYHPVDITYINDLNPATTHLHKDYIIIHQPTLDPHLLHSTNRDIRPERYDGPIPHVTHLHGAEG
jgi:hypothetical protein